MGLEGLEIVLATEETFAIAMPDAVAAAIQTPAELIEFIAANVPIATSQECLTQQLFYRLRRGFRSQLPSMSERFDLDTELTGSFTRTNGMIRGWRFVRRRAIRVGRSLFRGQLSFGMDRRPYGSCFGTWWLACRSPVKASRGRE